MDLTKLLPFLLKKAAEGLSVTPEEVAAQMQKAESQKLEDRDKETVDNDVIEGDEQQADKAKNEEGDMLESAFKELEVEDAIEKAKEQKQLQSNPSMDSTTNSVGVKFANCWELLKARLK